ncbi:MAG: DegT/DnrJ/EryC1/StrS family aminotransferase [Clostridiaceae bacterium]
MGIQLFRPEFRTNECLEAIRECLEQGWTGLGFKTVEFESEWKEYTGLNNALFLNSATSGLHLAIKALKIVNDWNDGDEIISTPMTFISTNHAILYEKLNVVFADIDEYLCLNPNDVRSKITDKTRAILFVGIGGNVGQYEEILKICKEYNLKLILDAAHMAGTRVNGVIPGKDADVVIYSFQAVKNLPTADSGMLCFKDTSLDSLCRKLSWMGINKDTYTRTLSEGAYKWKYDVEYLGYKYHGNSIMASIGLVQLKYLDRDNAYRRQLVKWYNDYFKEYQEKIGVIPIKSNCETSAHLYIIEVNNRDELLLALNGSGIFPGVHYIENTQYEMYSYAKGTVPNATRMSDRILSLPMHLGLTKEDISYICNCVIKYAR